MATIKTSELSQMTPVQLFDDPRIEARFTRIADKITQQGEIMFVREKQHFLRAISESPDLQACTPLSLFMCFIDIATLGLSVAKTKDPLAYLIPYTYNRGKTNEEKRAILEVSPYGELAIRKTFGQIEDVNNPVLVYEGDTFDIKEYSGNSVISYDNKHKQGARLRAGFIKIVKNHGRVEYFSMDMNDVERLRRYSEKKNGEANKLYTSNDGQIDEGFFRAKIIKHAFKAYPKAPYMQHVSAVFQTQKEDDEVLSLREVHNDVPEPQPVSSTTTTDINSDHY